MDNQAFELLKSSLEEIRHDMRDLKGELGEHKELLLRNTVSLEEHIRRTNMLQDHVTRLQDLVEKFENRIEHVDSHVNRIDSLIKIFAPTPKKIIMLFAAISAALSFFTSPREFVIKVLSELFR